MDLLSNLPGYNQVLELCSSTNDVAKNLAEAGCPHGTWVSCRRQEQGRGRRGREWNSAAGNLFLSVVIRPLDFGSMAQKMGWLPIAAGVGVTTELRQLNPAWDVQIKWPNDLWLNGGKLGGILCEGRLQTQNPYVVIGLGLNCLEAPDGFDPPARCLKTVSADEIRLLMVRALVETSDELFRKGLERIKNCYEEYALFKPGTLVTWQYPRANGTWKNGKILELGPLGELRVQAEDGLIHTLFSEDVRVRPARAASG